MSYSIGDGIVTLALAAAFVGYVHITHRSRQKRLEIIHQERLVAMEKGIPLPELPLDPEKVHREPDQTVLPIMGIAFFTLSVGGMVALYLTLPAKMHSFWVAPLPLAFLGLGLAAFHFLQSPTRR
jgi:hypothetical protein